MMVIHHVRRSVLLVCYGLLLLEEIQIAELPECLLGLPDVQEYALLHPTQVGQALARLGEFCHRLPFLFWLLNRGLSLMLCHFHWRLLFD